MLEEISQFKNLEPLPKKNHLGLDQNMSAFFFLCRIWSVFSDDRMAKKQFFISGIDINFPTVEQLFPLQSGENIIIHWFGTE